MGPCRFKKIGKNAIDLIDFHAHVFHHLARGTGRGQIAADDFDHAGDPGQGVANFVCQPGGQLPQCGQVLGT